MAEPAHRSNTLGLQSGALNRLLDGLDADTAGARSGKRTYARWPYRVSTISTTFRSGPTGQSSTVILAGRNLSKTGMALLHRAYVHAGTECVVQLPRLDGGLDLIEGRVTRCTHVSGVVHEIGVRFHGPIAVRKYIDQEKHGGLISLEQVDPASVHGSVLIVDDSPIDGRFVKKYLSSTAVAARQVCSVKEALDALREGGADLVLSDWHLPDGTAADLSREMRGIDIDRPIIVFTADTSVQTRKAAFAAGAIAVLIKPLRADALVCAVAEGLRDGAESKTGESASGSSSNEMLKAYLGQLGVWTTTIERSVTEGDVRTCLKTCLQVKGLAPEFGHKRVAELAAKAAELIAFTKKLDPAAEILTDLVAAARQASS